MTINIPATGSSSFKDPVSSPADLPIDNNKIGDIVLVGDTGTLNVWNGTTWVPITGSSSGTMVVEQVVLSLTNINNKYITLAHTPIQASNVELTVIGGVDQAFDVDFTVSGNQLGWSGLTLDGILITGDVLKINYFY